MTALILAQSSPLGCLYSSARIVCLCILSAGREAVSPRSEEVVTDKQPQRNQNDRKTKADTAWPLIYRLSNQVRLHIHS